MALPTGPFEAEFAARKRWKLDDNLLRAVLAVVPPGASVADLGAGIGRLVVALREAGREAYGVDGTPGIEELSGGAVLECDLASYECLEREWERVYAVTCIEVGEHVPPEHIPLFLASLCSWRAQLWIVSWARPGQRGRDHVSCHTPEWVSCELGHIGMCVDEDTTATLRRVAGRGWDRKLTAYRRRRR